MKLMKTTFKQFFIVIGASIDALLTRTPAAWILALLLPALAGCSTVKQDWEAAQQADTVSAYENYLSRHPGSDFGRAAGEKVEVLRWEAATKANTVEALNSFLQSHGYGPHNGLARNQLMELEWQAAVGAKSIVSLDKFLKDHPSSKRTNEASLLIDDLQWQAAAATNTLDSYEHYIYLSPRRKHWVEAQNKIGLIKEARRGQGIVKVEMSTTTEPQVMSGGITMTAAPMSDKGDMAAGKSTELAPKEGEVFLMVTFTVKLVESFDVDLHDDAVLRDAAGKEVHPYVRSPFGMLGAGGWSAGGFSITESAGSERSHRCMFVVQKAQLDSAMIRLWGREFPLKDHLKP